MLEELLTYERAMTAEEAVEQLQVCRAAVQACVEWRGSNDRERSVRGATENALQSCLDALRMAEIGLARDRRDMVDTASANLASAHERVLAIARVLQQ